MIAIVTHSHPRAAAPGAAEIRVPRPGGELIAHVAGPADAEPIVLLHGFPQRHTSWGPVVEELLAAGHRTVALDQRGYSESLRPRSRRDYRVELLVEDVVALLDVVGQERAHVVGHDWGAIVGWALAAGHRDRVSTYTAVSVPHPSAFFRSMRRPRQMLTSSYMALFQLPWLPEAILSRPRFARQMFESSGMTPEMIERYLDEVVATGAVRGAVDYYRGLPWSWRALDRVVEVPITLVWSDGDIAVGRSGVERCGRYVAGPFTTVVLPGASHWLPEECPKEVAAAINQRITSSTDVEMAVGGHREGGDRRRGCG